MPCAAGHPEEKALPAGHTGHVGLQGAAPGVVRGAGRGRLGARLPAWVSGRRGAGGPSHRDPEEPLPPVLGSRGWEPLADSLAPHLCSRRVCAVGAPRGPAAESFVQRVYQPFLTTCDGHRACSTYR